MLGSILLVTLADPCLMISDQSSFQLFTVPYLFRLTSVYLFLFLLCLKYFVLVVGDLGCFSSFLHFLKRLF
jgi:hypothetical protein